MKPSLRPLRLVPPVLITGLSLIACTTITDSNTRKPAPREAQLLKFRHSAIEHRYYDGKDNDLLTAGLGIQGLSSPIPPSFKDSNNPSVEELRRLAIYTNYRGIVSTNPAAGYGKFYGPKADQAAIPGHEYQSQSFYPDGSIAASFVVQVPDSFDPQNPCIVAAPSSGSRGVWGAIGTAGDWGLRKNCAVAYTDKGTGTGFYYLDNGQSYSAQGQLTNSGEGGNSTDIRIASKHAHSGKNIEKDWGRFTLQGVKMAFYLLNQHHRKVGDKRYFSRGNTTVIATSISNGGNSVLRSAEFDKEAWIDAVVASEPTVILPQGLSLKIQQNGEPGFINKAQNILSISNTMALYQPCALLAETATPSVFTPQINKLKPHLEQRCKHLSSAGLLKTKGLQRQSQEAQQTILATGASPSSYSLQAFSVAAQLWPALSINYSNSYGRFDVKDQLCGIGYGSIGAKGVAINTPLATRIKAFGLSSGIAPTAGINLLRKDQDNYYGWYYSPDNKQLDPGFESLLCLHQAYQQKPIQQGIKAAEFSGDFQHKPTIILHGIQDSLVFINHNARSLMAYRAQKFPKRNNVHYYEIDNAQHFDSLLGLPEFSSQLIPLHYYYEQALDLMWNHLKQGTALPPHQKVNSLAKGKGITQENLPPIKLQPGNNAISIRAGNVIVP